MLATRTLLIAALVAAAPALGCGDAKVSAATMDAVASDPTSCQEQHPEGVVAFAVGPDGTVRAGVVGADGKAAKIDGGTLTFRKEGGAPTEAKLAPEGDGTVATAKGPALDGDVTAVDYAVQTGGKTLAGVLHLPAGGTKALAESATAAPPEAAPGPNGGQVQTVAGEPIEVAVGPDGEVVAYVLDPSKKTVVTTTAGRTIWVLVDGEKIALTRRDDGAYVGRTTVAQPRKVSLVVVRDDRRHVVVVGHQAGAKIAASRAPGKVVVATLKAPSATGDANAPSVAVDVNRDDGGRDHAKGKEKEKRGNGLGNDKPGTPGYKGDKDVGKSHGKGGGNDKGKGKGNGNGKK